MGNKLISLSSLLNGELLGHVAKINIKPSRCELGVCRYTDGLVLNLIVRIDTATF